MAERNEIWQDKYALLYPQSYKRIMDDGNDSDAEILEWISLCVQCDPQFNAPYRLPPFQAPSNPSQEV